MVLLPWAEKNNILETLIGINWQQLCKSDKWIKSPTVKFLDTDVNGIENIILANTKP